MSQLTQSPQVTLTVDSTTMTDITLKMRNSVVATDFWSWCRDNGVRYRLGTGIRDKSGAYLYSGEMLTTDIPRVMEYLNSLEHL
jgi:hypothetical protein